MSRAGTRGPQKGPLPWRIKGLSQQKLDKVEVAKAVSPLVFTIKKDGAEVGTKEFNQRSILIGRGDAANLHIDDPKASKLHAVIDITTDEEIHILDLGSTNGTKVNGEKIHRQKIGVGDEISVGHTTLTFAFRTLSEAEEKSVERFHTTFDSYFNEDPEPEDPNARGAERRKVIEVAQIWGDSIVQMTHFMRPEKITIGESKECNFFSPVEALPGDNFPLVNNQGRRYYLQFTDTFSGHVELDGKTTSLTELVSQGEATKHKDGKFEVYRYRIHPNAKIRVELGSLTFLVQRVRPARLVPVDFFKRLDYMFLGVFGITILTLVGGALAIWILTILGIFMRPDLVDDLTRNEDIVASLIIEPEKKDIPIPKSVPIPRKKESAGNPDAGEGDKARGDEGKRGRQDAKHENTRGGAFKAPSDKDIVDGAGVLGALTAQNADLNAIFGSGQLAGGMNDNIGGLVGSTTADQRGSGGLGLKGTGKGGGGNSLNVGGLGTKGRGTGASGHGSGAGVFGKGKGDASIGIGGEETVIMGSLDPAIIDAVIKRHLAQIKYCYDRELPAKPKLHGKLVVQFVIESDGRVSTAKMHSSSMKDASVESCVADRFKKIRFPQPKGGGIVSVKYPLVFNSAGN